jgi:hypothetical protein
MSDQDIINAIRADRNMALDALEDAIVSIDVEIEQAPSDNLSYLKQLNRRRQDLVDERGHIMDAAAVVILSLPSVIAAAQRLNQIASDMKTIAQKLPNATDKLTTLSAVLSLGQQFTDLIANVQKLST